MSRAVRTKWSQRSVAVGLVFFVTWHGAALLDAPRRTLVVLALYGFIIHVLLGKAYSLVPSYFDRELTVPWTPVLGLALTAPGTVALALAGWGLPAGTDPLIAAFGNVSWSLGVLIGIGGIGWSIRHNLTGAETATGEVNATRRDIDRVANAGMPIALTYLVAGAVIAGLAGIHPVFGPFGSSDLLPSLIGVDAARSHLLAAGGATLMLFAVGFRLLPRFAVADPPAHLHLIVLPCGAIAPALLVYGVSAIEQTHIAVQAFRAGAILEGVAILGFAWTIGTLLVRTDRDRVGFPAVGLGAAFGVVGVVFGVYFAFVGRPGPWIRAHLRTNLLGFLGLSIVGAAYQFYPPAVIKHRLAGDRQALLSIGLLGGGLTLQVLGLLRRSAGPHRLFSRLTSLGEAVSGLGALLVATLVIGLFVTRGEL